MYDKYFAIHILNPLPFIETNEDKFPGRLNINLKILFLKYYPESIK